MDFLNSVSYSSKLIQLKKAVVGTSESQSVRSTGNNLDLWLASEVQGRGIGTCNLHLVSQEHRQQPGLVIGIWSRGQSCRTEPFTLWCLLWVDSIRIGLNCQITSWFPENGFQRLETPPLSGIETGIWTLWGVYVFLLSLRKKQKLVIWFCSLPLSGGTFIRNNYVIVYYVTFLFDPKWSITGNFLCSIKNFDQSIFTKSLVILSDS